MTGRWCARRAWTIGVGLLLAACSSSSTPTPDAGTAGQADGATTDAGPADAGLLDAGVADAGAEDAGVTDAGPMDAGVADAGPGDAGAPDAGLCGNGVVDPGEQCDPGMNPPSNDGCGAPGTAGECQFIPAPGSEDACPGQAVSIPAGQTVLAASSGLSTYGFRDDYTGSCAAGTGGLDRVFQLTPAKSGTLTVSVGYQPDGTTPSCDPAMQTSPYCWVPVLYARSSCAVAQTELGCALGQAPASANPAPASLSFPVTANTAYWLFVDGNDGTSHSDGPFNLIVKLQ